VTCHHTGPTPDYKVQPEVAPQRDYPTRPSRYPVDPPLPRNKHSRKRRGFRFGRWVRNKTYYTKRPKHLLDSLVSFVLNPRLHVVFKIMKRFSMAIGIPKSLPIPSLSAISVGLTHSRGKGFSSNNAGDGPKTIFDLSKIIPVLPKYDSKNFADFKLKFLISLPIELSKLLNDKMATPVDYAQRNPHNAAEYRDIYDYHNRTCYQILCKVVENDIEANALILAPQFSDTTDGLHAWQALIAKHTQVSNTEKFNTVLRTLNMKQEETESTEQYKIREQQLQNLITSQQISLSDIRLSV